MHNHDLCLKLWRNVCMTVDAMTAYRPEYHQILRMRRSVPVYCSKGHGTDDHYNLYYNTIFRTVVQSRNKHYNSASTSLLPRSSSICSIYTVFHISISIFLIKIASALQVCGTMAVIASLHIVCMYMYM